MSHPYPPLVHFTAPINAFSASSDGRQQRSAPLFGSGAWPSMTISSGQPVIGAPVNKSVLVDVPVKIYTRAVLDDDRRVKDSVFVAFGRAREGPTRAP